MAKPHVTERAAVATVHLAILQLLECAGFSEHDALTDVTVNFDGRAMRIDIARLSADGRRIAEFLRGYSVNPSDLQAFGTPAPLPGTDGPTH